MRTKANDQNEKEKLVVQKMEHRRSKSRRPQLPEYERDGRPGDGKGKWGWNNGRK